MIRARRTTPAGTTVLLGLSDENIRRLREGKPILVEKDEELRLSVDVVIFTGATEVEMVRILEEEGVLPEGSVVKTEQAMADGDADVVVDVNGS